MQILDEGLVLSLRNYGENGLIVTIFSKHNGLMRGYYKFSKKNKKPLLFDLVSFKYKSRTNNSLGYISFETQNNFFINRNNYIFSIIASSICELCLKLIPINEKNINIYNDVLVTLSFPNPEDNIKLYIKQYLLWEFYLLQHLGFGLDINECAVTGVKTKLRYVSPKTGKAVCEKIGKPWKDKILKLPNFFKEHRSPINTQDLIDGFNLTNFFINKLIINLFYEKKIKLIFRKEIFRKLLTMQNL